MVYELDIWIKMLHMTFSKSQSCGNSVQQVYILQPSCKFTYIQLQATIQLAIDQSLISFLKLLLAGVLTSHLDQNAPHDFLLIPQLWEFCTASVHTTVELQIYLQATIQLATYQSLISYLNILLVGVRASRLD